VSPDVARVLALQRSAGNAAVGRMLARQGEAPAALLSDGDAAAGAMPVPQFLARVRDTAAAIQGAEQLEPWLARAAELDAASLERALREFAPGAAGAASAEELVTAVCARIQELAAQQAPAVQAKRTDGAPAAGAPHDVLDRLGEGEPLPAQARSPMEAAFGESFGDVRLHRDPAAAGLARELSARAFAVGSHVAFAAGEYAPGTPVGDALLAHELAHVQQQRDDTAPAVDRKSAAGETGAALEEDADVAAVNAVASLWSRAGTAVRATALPRLRSGLRLTRCAGPATAVRTTTPATAVPAASPGTQIPAGPVAAGSYGGVAQGVPPNWAQDVAAARSGNAAARFALIRAALPGLTVVDRTAECASDQRVNREHLVAYDSGSPTVSYDDNLNAKEHRANNAGFTTSHAHRSYVVLGPKALSDDFYVTRQTANHEFDHVRQDRAGSGLRGDESEVDAWTSTFCRDFHTNYVVQVTGANALINQYFTATSLLGYYESTTVGDAVRQDCRRRIADYYRQTLAPHPIHARVFKWWIYRTIRSGANPRLADELNTELALGVDRGAPAASMRQFPAAELAGTTIPGAPTVNPP
jgi:DNA-binding phage protein